MKKAKNPPFIIEPKEPLPVWEDQAKITALRDCFGITAANRIISDFYQEYTNLSYY